MYVVEQTHYVSSHTCALCRWIKCFVELQLIVLVTLIMLHSLVFSNMVQKMNENQKIPPSNFHRLD